MKKFMIAFAGLCVFASPLFLTPSIAQAQTTKNGWIRISKEDFDLRSKQLLRNEKEMVERGLPSDLDQDTNAMYMVASDTDDAPVELNDQVQAMNNAPEIVKDMGTVIAAIPRDHIFYAIDNDSSIDFTRQSTRRTQKFYGAQIRLHRHLFTNPVLVDDNRDFRFFAGYLVHRVGIEPETQKFKSFFTGVSYWVHFGHVGE